MRVAFVLCMVFAVTACGRGARTEFQGYAEADYLYLSAREPGEIVTLSVTEGDDAAAGAQLFTLDSERHAAAVSRARATYEAAQARVADLETGARQDEIDALGEALNEARAARTLAQQTYTRTRELSARGQAPKARLDEARASLASAEAGVKRAEAELDLAQLPARSAAIDAARREAEAAAASLLIAEKDLSDRTVTAPEAGRIELIFRRPGERAGANEPVLALLPPARLKLRFFVPETVLSHLALGEEIMASCDACDEPIGATIAFIASEPEFTPPVIYSRSERAKLVYLVEARPAEGAALRPGQPLDIRLAP